MIIRTLDQDIDHNELTVTRGCDDDVHVTVIENTVSGRRKAHNVRIGGFHSGGPDIPADVIAALNNLADVFEKYADCQYEEDAYNKSTER